MNSGNSSSPRWWEKQDPGGDRPHRLLWRYYQKMKKKQQRTRLIVTTTELCYLGDVTRSWRFTGTSCCLDGLEFHWFRHWFWVSSVPAETGNTGAGTWAPCGDTSMMSKQWGGGAQLNMNTAHWRTGDPLRAERYEMLFLVWRKSEVEICHLWCEAVLFVQSPVNKTVWAGLFFSVFVQVRYPARLALQEHLFWQDWSVSVAPSIQKLLKSNVSSDL